VQRKFCRVFGEKAIFESFYKKQAFLDNFVENEHFLVVLWKTDNFSEFSGFGSFFSKDGVVSNV
jgi:hypothetical protein